MTPRASRREGRRSFLRVGLWGGAVLGLAAIVGRNLSGYALPVGVEPPRALSTKELLVLAAVVERVVAPDGLDAPLPNGLAIASWLDGYIGRLDVPLRRDLSALFQLLEHGSGLTRFSRMSADARDRVLEAWMTSRLAVRRQGFQGLRALAFMGYYRQDATWPILGYPGPMVR